MTGVEIWDEALRWQGTPFHHLGRTRGTGCDCVGLILGVAWALGLYGQDHQGYGRVPAAEYQGAPVREWLQARATVIPEPEVGAVAFLLRFGMPHFAFLDGTGWMVHADAAAGQVVYTRWDGRWQRRTQELYRLRGVQ